MTAVSGRLKLLCILKFNLKRNSPVGPISLEFSKTERKIVWAEGKIRADWGVILHSGAPNDFSRTQRPDIKKVITVALQIKIRLLN